MLGYNIYTRHRRPEISNPEDIAKAIHGPGEISNGKVSTITVTGGIECAFIAAFAHWLLNLSISVEDEAGRVIYQDLPPEQAQVIHISASRPFTRASFQQYLHPSKA